MKFVIVIPTYNEAGNIGLLIDELARICQTMPAHDFHVLVVEGNSPDGTADVVRAKQKEHPFVHLLMEKEKAGLGAAYMYGFKHALEHMNPDVLVEMDADFQHDPEDLPKLVTAIEQGADYVIGARYIEGGSIPKEWPFKRKFLSIVGCWVAKIVLGIFNVNDFSTGFRATRVALLQKMDLDTVLSAGFAYKYDLLYRMSKLGADIREVPITFGVRDRGVSKMEQNNAMDSLRVIFALRLKDSQVFLKFCVVGGVGFVTDMGLANIFRLTPLPANVAASSSALIAMFVTYYLNNVWSFAHSRITSMRKTAKSLAVYIPLSCVPILFRFWFVGFIVGRFGNTFATYNTAILISIILGLVWNFTVYSKIIWRKK